MGDSNGVNKDKMDDILITVETLEKEYEVTLKQYQEAFNNYINALQTNIDDSAAQINFTKLPGRTWWGTGALKDAVVSTSTECESMCASDLSCSGATFNPVKRHCWTRTGDANITAGIDTDYALIPAQKAALSVLKSLNVKLLSLNQQIGTYLKQINPQVKQQQLANLEKQQQMNEYYQTLLQQKIQMEKQLQDYYSIEQNNENQSLSTNQQNKSYRIWSLLAALILIITLRKMFGVESVSSTIIFWLFIIIILIILSFNISSPSGFIMWCIFLTIIGINKIYN
jgi:hypothetical protein